MATVTLERRAAERGELPPICAKCGAKATTQVDSNFAYKKWPLPGAAKLLALRWVPVKLPLCEAHKAMWFWDRVNMVAVCCVVLVCLILSQQMYEESNRFSGNGASAIPSVLYYGGVVVLIGFLLLLRTTFVRPGTITDTHITLKGVAKEFANAVASRRVDKPLSNEK